MKKKRTMYFGAGGGRIITVDLCCFCARSNNLIRPADCPYYEDGFEDASCVGFQMVDDLSLRIKTLLEQDEQLNSDDLCERCVGRSGDEGAGC